MASEYTYEQVITALRNADAAGDTEAATQLAKMAAQMQQTADQEPPSQEATPSAGEALQRGAGLAGRALVTGGSFPVNAVGDFASGVFNAGANLVGSEARIPTMSGKQQQGLNDLGLPNAETLPEKALVGGIESLSGVGAVNMLAKGIPAAAGLVTESLPGVTSAAVAGASSPVSYGVLKNLTGSDAAATLGAVGLSTIAGAAAGAAVNGRLGKSPVVTMAEVRNRAKQAYEKVNDAGIAIKPQSALSMVDDMEQALLKERFVPDLQPEVGTVLKKFRDVIGQKRLPFTELEQLRGTANDLKNNPDKNIQRLASVMVNEVDSYISRLNDKDLIAGKQGIDEAVKLIVSARKDWRNQARASLLEKALDVAEIKAAKPTASEAELIRDGFISIAKDEKKMRLFTPDERAAIIRVTKGIPLDTVLGQLARFNPMRNQLLGGGAALGTATAAGTGNTGVTAAGGVLMAAGWTADQVQKALRSRQGRQVISDILSGNVRPHNVYGPQGLFGSTTGLPERLYEEDVEAVRAFQ